MITTFSLGQILRPFCAENPSQYPALAFPVRVPGTAGRTLTFASDGETAAIWTAGALGRYRDWSAAGSPDQFSPLEWRGLYRSGASTPLPLPHLMDGGAAVWWLGRVGVLAPRWVTALQRFDACWLSGSKGTPAPGKYWPALSFIATVDKRVFNGVIKCPEVRG